MKKLFGLLLVIFAMVSVGLGQAISVNGGSIQGTITDSTGAVVPNAEITIRGTETGFTKSLSADASGYYAVGPLNPGEYSVDVTASGFQKLTVKTVVRTGTATPGSFKLTVGSAVDTVEVNAGALQVNTEQAGVSDVITAEQIKSLPVNGRNFLDLAQIEPGVILQSGETFDPTKAGYSAISIGGVSGRTTRILLDGQDITDETVGTTIFNVSQGAISEFQLNRSTQDVSGEVTSTGQVLVATNSGTNAVHGQLFYQFQDHRALFARAQNGQDPQFQRNQFGGSVGGPILRDKLFFFANAERIKQDSSSVAPVSTGAGAHFTAIQAANPFIPSPYRETYSTGRLDYNGPLGGHYFARINYNVNAVSSNFGLGYALYANRDNTPGIAGGADFSTGRFTHSFRASYEKFHNLISDTTTGSSIYQTVPGVFVRFSTQGLISGPNYLAPQGTFQSDKQFRYDGSWTKGRHNIRYGYSLNRILGGGYAAFFGLSPYQTETETTVLTGVTSATNPYGFGCGGVVGAAPCPTDPAQGYRTSTAEIGNGQGSFTEKAAFGLPGSGVEDWRQGAYVSDNWKVTPSLTLVAGLRWSVDTDRANQDLATPLCSDVDPSLESPCSGSTPLFSQWNPTLGKKVHQPYGNFGPQIGFNFSPGNHKTSIRGGAGVFYEGDVFNNTTNARNALIKQGAFFDRQVFCSGGGKYSVTFPDGTVVSSVNGVSINQLCFSPVAISGPAFVQLQKDYQANTRANSDLANGGFVGATLTAAGVYGAPYRTPYSEQFNGGIQQELFKGSFISVDFIHNSTLKIAQTIDQNHVGAARYLNTTAATAAITATTAGAGCAGGASAAAINCAIAAGADLSTFAGNGLDSGNQYLGGNPASYNGLTTATGAAFPGVNPLLGNGNFLLPIGRSGYDALQVVYKQVTAHPVRGIESMNFQASYNLSRIVTTGTNAGQGGSDAFFSSAAADNDDPNRYFGRAGLDRAQQLSMGGSFTFKYGPRLGLLGHFNSAPPTSLILDDTAQTGSIFQTDITGDGTTADFAPGTSPGDYMHGIKSKNLQSYINNFNASHAGTLTPAGQALVSAGLFSPSQLYAIGAVVQPIASLPQSTGIKNPAFRSLDVNFSYPIRFYRLHEGLSLEPQIVFYNIGNFANYASDSTSGVLLNTLNAGGSINTPGQTNDSGNYITGLNNYDVLNGNRNQRGSGTFDQGAARSTEFQLKLNF